MSADSDYDICVIGGGSAGLVVAAGAAGLGARVLLVEKHRLGGDCLYTGCVPSKALLHHAQVAHTVRMATGGPGTKPSINAVPAAMDYVRAVIAAIEPHDSPEHFASLGVEVAFGNGEFEDARHFVFGERRVRARTFVVATGSHPFIPPIDGLQQTPYLTNETLFSLREPVPALVILGAGPIGVEMAQAFARLGSRVSLVGIAPQLLPREDPDVARVVHDRLRAEGVDLYLGHQAMRVEASTGSVTVRLRGPDHNEVLVSGSHLLVATGRIPNSDGLGLAKAGVTLDDRGYVQVDRRLRSSNKRLFACGDVAGPFLFTHTAEHQAGVVLRNALFHLPARTEQRVVPWCTFTDPEVARVGLSEVEAQQQGLAYSVDRFPFADIDRAVADGVTQGFIKVLTKRSGRILGACLVGPHAGELIHEYVLAMGAGLKLSRLSGLIHIYPTLSQINRRVADQRLKQQLTPGRRRWLQRLFRLRGE